MTELTRWTISTHEAGHAIIGAVLGFTIESIHIYHPQPNGTKVGTVRWEKSASRAKLIEGHAYAMIITAVAGAEAEMFFHPWATDRVSDGDFEAIYKGLRLLGFSDPDNSPEALELCEKLRGITTRLIHRHQARIHALAVRLMTADTIVGSDIA